jgi:hypothetical protein
MCQDLPFDLMLTNDNFKLVSGVQILNRIMIQQDIWEQKFNSK